MTITDTQRQRRSGGLGSSDSPVILGVSRWRSPADVLAEKLGAVPITDEPPSHAARMGAAMEPVIADMVEDALGVRLVSPTSSFALAGTPLLAHPDRFVGRAARREPIVELKRSRVGSWGPSGTDAIPDDVMIQVQHQMMCTESPECTVARLDPMSDALSLYTIRPHGDLQALILRECSGWWERHVERREPLPPGSAPPSDETLRRLQRTPGRVAMVSPETLGAFIGARELLKLAEEREGQVRRALLAELGDADSGTDGAGNRVTYFACKDGVRFDAKRFAADHPDLYAQYCVLRPGYRTLRIASKGDDA